MGRVTSLGDIFAYRDIYSLTYWAIFQLLGDFLPFGRLFISDSFVNEKSNPIFLK
jgi:hypothetical protein